MQIPWKVLLGALVLFFLNRFAIELKAALRMWKNSNPPTIFESTIEGVAFTSLCIQRSSYFMKTFTDCIIFVWRPEIDRLAISWSSAKVVTHDQYLIYQLNRCFPKIVRLRNKGNPLLALFHLDADLACVYLLAVVYWKFFVESEEPDQEAILVESKPAAFVLMNFKHHHAQTLPINLLPLLTNTGVPLMVVKEWIDVPPWVLEKLSDSAASGG